jgi:DNA-binding transcriptional ArsR family regulator
MGKVFEALAHPTRRAILGMLKGGSKTAGELADAFDVSKPTMSGHFAKEKEAGLITWSASAPLDAGERGGVDQNPPAGS